MEHEQQTGQQPSAPAELDEAGRLLAIAAGVVNITGGRPIVISAGSLNVEALDLLERLVAARGQVWAEAYAAGYRAGLADGAGQGVKLSRRAAARSGGR